MNNHATMSITLKELWKTYGRGESGRFKCPITMADGQEVTHIYQGYGVIRLEYISRLIPGKKGFQGRGIAYDEIYNHNRDRVFKIRD